MIRHGRSVVDRAGVAWLHGMTWHTARRHRPWDRPGHPSPVNESSGARRRGWPPALWDTEQVQAYVAERDVPAIDAEDHPDDLLDDREVAAMHGLPLKEFIALRNGSRVNVTIPDPDAAPCDVPHWRRATAESMQLRLDPAAPRPTGDRAELHAALAAEAAAMARSGEPITSSELARRTDVSWLTAHKFVRKHYSASDQ